MPLRPKSFAVVAAAAAAATLAVAAPAAAEPDYHVSFFTGAGNTGTEIPADIDAPGPCVTLPQAARSALNIAPVDVDVYFRADCATGTPSGPSDLYFRLGSLHSAEFPYPAVSYRVRAMGS